MFRAPPSEASNIRCWLLPKLRSSKNGIQPYSGTLISKWNAKFTFIWKEDFGPLSNNPVIFLLSPSKMLLMLLLFQKWLGSRAARYIVQHRYCDVHIHDSHIAECAIFSILIVIFILIVFTTAVASRHPALSTLDATKRPLQILRTLCQYVIKRMRDLLSGICLVTPHPL